MFFPLGTNGFVCFFCGGIRGGKKTNNNLVMTSRDSTVDLSFNALHSSTFYIFFSHSTRSLNITVFTFGVPRGRNAFHGKAVGIHVRVGL